MESKPSDVAQRYIQEKLSSSHNVSNYVPSSFGCVQVDLVQENRFEYEDHAFIH